VERIVELMEDLADPQLALAVDTTGVGRPVRDMLNRRLITSGSRRTTRDISWPPGSR
jgi:hypothetical protein